MVTDAIRRNLEVVRPLGERLRLADPLLMGAAIAFNTFFAMVPLAIAFVAALSFFGRSEEGIVRLTTFLEDLPDDLADFIVDLVVGAAELVGNSGSLVIVIALLVALWSGSRGIYALQKALRLMDQAIETRRYWRSRGLGILLTVASGLAFVLAYVVFIFGDHIVDFFETVTGQTSFGAIRQAVGIPILTIWVYLVLYAIYRWGPPQPVPGAWFAALLTALLTLVGTFLFSQLVPRFGGTTVAILGTVGVILLWLYYMGIMVILVPGVVGWTWPRRQALLSALRRAR